MSHPGDDGWMQGYSGVIVESNPVKQSKQKSHPRRPFVADLGPLSPHVSDRFPPELVDRILDHLHSDRNTLSSCSLVCKAWLASSRYQLFGNATVRLHQNNAAQFFELLDAPSSIACYICHLEVEEGRFYRLPDSEDSESQVNDSEAGDDGILPRVTGLVSITSLRLRSLHGDLPHAVTRSLMRNFQTLIELELYSCVLESFAQFLCIVGTLPLLQRIRLAFVCWDNELSSAPDNQRPLSHLRDLDFHSSDHVSELLDWLLSYERVPAISHLKLDCITQAATIGQFLYALGPTLEHIVLRGFTDHSKLDLSRNYRLRTIRLNRIVITRHSEPASVEWVTALLSQIISRQVEGVTLQINLDDPDALIGRLWHRSLHDRSSRACTR